MRVRDPQAVSTGTLTLVDALPARELTPLSCGSAFREHFGAPYPVGPRRDLHGALLEACRKREEITLHTSKELASFGETAGRLLARFADGSEYEGAAMVGAGALRSAGPGVISVDGHPRPSGHVHHPGGRP